MFALVSRPTGAADLTIYDGDFAVVHDVIPAELKEGSNRIVVSNVPAFLEPYSFVLNSSAPGGVRMLQLDYPGKVATPEGLYSIFEGSTIPFVITTAGESRTIDGKILRSSNTGRGVQPVIEVNGRLCVEVPGKPQFPPLPEGVTLNPTLTLTLESKQAGHADLDVSYVTRGITWQADYNAILTEQGGLELVGWMTLTNTCGKSFDNAKLRLATATDRPDKPARPGEEGYYPPDAYQAAAYAAARSMRTFAPLPSVRTDFQYFSLPAPVALIDGSPVRVEFVRRQQAALAPAYVYDGWKMPANMRADYLEGSQRNRTLGTESRKEVIAMGEFTNAPEDGPGSPLPSGRLHAFRRNKGQLDFLGDDKIGPLPVDGKVSLFLGNAEGLSGSRRQTSFKEDQPPMGATESFEIALKNDTKTEAVIRVIEHLYRGKKWEITESSDPYQKLPDGTVEFRVQIKPAEEKKITYTAHCTW
ncbi:MAG: hypothetical protein HZB26_06720 [Candidatus Hydrogenedentes bacterium]|nr:hypothetical protein [Candidatus Hydrogenedentota bacterium]